MLHYHQAPGGLPKKPHFHITLFSPSRLVTTMCTHSLLSWTALCIFAVLHCLIIYCCSWLPSSSYLMHNLGPCALPHSLGVMLPSMFLACCSWNIVSALLWSESYIARRRLCLSLLPDGIIKHRHLRLLSVQQRDTLSSIVYLLCSYSFF